MVNAIINKAILHKCNIVIGYPYGLKNISNKKKRKSNKKARGKTIGFNYNVIIDRLITKATLLKIPVIVVDEAYTSQRCFKCKTINKQARKGQEYRCKECGYNNQADLNGCCNQYSNSIDLLSTSQGASRKSECSSARFSAVEVIKRFGHRVQTAKHDMEGFEEVLSSAPKKNELSLTIHSSSKNRQKLPKKDKHFLETINQAEEENKQKDSPTKVEGQEEDGRPTTLVVGC